MKDCLTRTTRAIRRAETENTLVEREAYEMPL